MTWRLCTIEALTTDCQRLLLAATSIDRRNTLVNWIVRWMATGEERFNSEIHARNFAFYTYMYPGLRKAFEDRADIFRKRAAATVNGFQEPPLYEMTLPYLKQFDETTPEMPENRTFIVW